MKIGLASVDSKIPNLALMKISAYHKLRGDKVELFSPLFGGYDLVYASKVFTDTPDDQYLPHNTIKGGSGYNLKTTLPEKIESIYPDYSLFNCDYAMGFTSRGCCRNCPWCIVPEKEGKIKAVADIYSFWNGQKYLMLFDNNLTALPLHFRLILQQIRFQGIYVDFNQGLDIRLINLEVAQVLATINLWKQLRFAWDSMNYEQEVRRGIQILIDGGVTPRKLMFYVLIGFNTTPEEDLYRVKTLRELGIDSFVMPYNKKDEYQKSFARWVNHKAIFKSVEWKDYDKFYRRHKPKKYKLNNEREGTEIYKG